MEEKKREKERGLFLLLRAKRTTKKKKRKKRKKKNGKEQKRTKKEKNNKKKTSLTFFKGKPYGVEVDMWALGCIAYIMMAGFPPFDGENDAEILASILSVR